MAKFHFSKNFEPEIFEKWPKIGQKMIFGKKKEKEKKKNGNEDQIFDQWPSPNLCKDKCVHIEVSGSILIVFLAFFQCKYAKNDDFFGKIGFVAQRKFCIAPTQTTKLSEPWPMSSDPLQWGGEAILATQGPQSGAKIDQKWAFWHFLLFCSLW